MHGLMDLARKTTKPNTYPCKLCMNTYNGAVMNKLWKNYVASLSIPSVFMHRNEFEAAYPEQKVTYPAVLLKTNTLFKTILSSNDFKQLRDVADLINALNERLSNGKRK